LPTPPTLLVYQFFGCLHQCSLLPSLHQVFS
jgi:hypothetical protein